jgi:hypothetical protein
MTDVPTAPNRHLTKFNYRLSAVFKGGVGELTEAETAPPFPGVRSCPYIVAVPQRPAGGESRRGHTIVIRTRS